MNIIFCLKKIVRKNTIKNRNNIWIFGEWHGDRCCDSSLYFANYVANCRNDLKLYWIAKKNCDLQRLNKKIEVLEYDTDNAAQIIEKSSVIFINTGFSDLSSNKNFLPLKSYIVNLWHGIPWKKIGLDAQKKKSLIHNIRKLFWEKFSMYDYFLSPSDKFSSVLKSSYRLDGDKIIKIGAPRNSIFFENIEIEKCKNKLKALVNQDYEKAIIYLPTFRDNEKVFDMNRLAENNKFYNYLKDNKIVLITKKHINDSKNISENSLSENIVSINNEISTQELMAASDMLITDYSSCSLDYLLLNKPIIYYLFDYDYYINKDRGVYYSKEEFCAGDCVFSVDDLIGSIIDNIENPSKNIKLREQKRNTFMTFEDRHTCEKLLNFVGDVINK